MRGKDSDDGIIFTFHPTHTAMPAFLCVFHIWDATFLVPADHVSWTMVIAEATARAVPVVDFEAHIMSLPSDQVSIQW